MDSPVRCKSEGVIQRVALRTLARKQLRRMPRHIVENLAAWVDDVETRGLEAVRKVPGYHDEPLHGEAGPAGDSVKPGLSGHVRGERG